MISSRTKNSTFKKIYYAICTICFVFLITAPTFAGGRKDSDHAIYATSEELSKQNNPAAAENDSASKEKQADTKTDTANSDTTTVTTDNGTSTDSTTVTTTSTTTTSDASPSSTAATTTTTTTPVLLSTITSLEVPLCPATRPASPSSPEPFAPGHEVHAYTGFELCYREDYEDAEWVAYCLTKDELNTVIGRTDDFRADTKITTGSATPGDYVRSGYDRGHLAPAADMEWSEKAAHDSFLMSNMTPQAPQFNRGMWKELEAEVRTWAATFGAVYVVTGPILEKEASQYKHIGTNEVAIPEYFYKVLLAQLSDEMHTVIGIGFILPNTSCTGTIYDYAVSIDEVEQRTGLDFYAPLPDEIETPVEESKDISHWE